MAAKPTQSRKGVKGQLPLAESRGGASGGAWGNAPTVPRATSYAKRAQQRAQAAQRPCAVTLRVRRRAPKLLFQPIQHCRARWARLTSIGRSRFLSVLVFFVAGISPLRRRPEGFAVALWTASRPHLSLLSFIETNLVGVPFVPKQQYKSINRSVHCEGVKGATADFVCFHCPLVASAEAIPPATIKINSLSTCTKQTMQRSDHCYANPQFFLPDGVLRAPHRAPEPRQ